MIQIEGLGIRYGERVLFSGASLNMNIGCRYGITGANGSGKTTLLKMLAGEITIGEGRVKIPADVKVGFLKQNHFEYEKERIIDTVIMGRPRLWSAIKEKDEIHETGLHDAETGMRLAELEAIIGEEHGYGAESEASIILEGLGIDGDRHKDPMGSFSGGYKLRVLLAQCLFEQPGLLLLDEPTNHLDIGSIAWMEEYLKSYPGIVVVVSHDHHFLNAVATHILDIDYELVKLYHGNYDDSLEAKALERAQQEQTIASQQKKKDELTAFYNRFRGQATKARQAMSRKKQADKMDEIVIKRSSRIAPRFRFQQTRPPGKQVLGIEGLTKGFGEGPVIDDLTLAVMRGERVAVIGPNGAGKTTLIKLIFGELDPDKGESNYGHEVSAGYFAQNHKEQVEGGSTPYKWLMTNSGGKTQGEVRSTLGAMLFSGDDADKNTAALSGGEAARLVFARLILARNNLLLLDEPTNHLDIESIEALSEALVEYPGTVVLVSHDRFFVEHVATAILEIRVGGYEYFSGGYEEFLATRETDHLERGKASSGGKAKKPGAEKKSEAAKGPKRDVRSLSKEKDRLVSKGAKIEKAIKALEEEKEGINETLATGELYWPGREEELEEALARLKAAGDELDKKLSKWETLHVRIEEIEGLLG